MDKERKVIVIKDAIEEFSKVAVRISDTVRKGLESIQGKVRNPEEEDFISRLTAVLKGQYEALRKLGFNSGEAENFIMRKTQAVMRIITEKEVSEQ